ncbi:MAG TPA: ribosome small subunit-dependent GTPase A [Vicinamibacterales bacterium]|nr:ribosome small subunit-dependent GTPase A [Vicinamibacterales bacterium]
MDPLERYGWNPGLAAAFADHAAPGRVPGRVVLEHTHIYRVMTGDGETLARVSGRLRHRALTRPDFPVVGDWVVVELLQGGDARIHAVLPRFSRFSRRAAGDVTEEQVVAANIDTVFLIGGLDGDFNPRRIERYLVVAWESGATPVVVLNKADLVEDAARHVAEVESVAPGVDVRAVSAKRPESLEVLRRYLGVGRSAALLGSSGVGKSTIVNRLVGYDLLRTQDVRITDSRGRHTSTTRQMVLLESGGILIDTPGMRELQLWDSGEALGDAFADIEELATACRFRDCRHVQEPDCAVQAAVASGDLASTRLDSFHKLAAEREYQSRQLDSRALLEDKRRARVMGKALQKHLKDKGAR